MSPDSLPPPSPVMPDPSSPGSIAPAPPPLVYVLVRLIPGGFVWAEGDGFAHQTPAGAETAAGGIDGAEVVALQLKS